MKRLASRLRPHNQRANPTQAQQAAVRQPPMIKENITISGHQGIRGDSLKPPVTMIRHRVDSVPTKPYRLATSTKDPLRRNKERMPKRASVQAVNNNTNGV